MHYALAPSPHLKSQDDSTPVAPTPRRQRSTCERLAYDLPERRMLEWTSLGLTLSNFPSFCLGLWYGSVCTCDDGMVWVGTPGVACEAFTPSSPKAESRSCHRPKSPLYSAKLHCRPTSGAAHTPLNLHAAVVPRSGGLSIPAQQKSRERAKTVSRQSSQKR